MNIQFTIETLSTSALILFLLVALFVANPYLKIILGSISDYFFEKRFKKQVKKFLKK